MIYNLGSIVTGALNNKVILILNVCFNCRPAMKTVLEIYIFLRAKMKEKQHLNLTNQLPRWNFTTTFTDIYRAVQIQQQIILCSHHDESYILGRNYIGVHL